MARLPSFRSFLLLSHVAAAVAACASKSGGARTDADPTQPPPECLARETSPSAAGDAGTGTGTGEPIRCTGEASGAGAGDCPAGYRCNTSLGPPVCQKLYCGTPGSLCSSQELCKDGMQCFEGKCNPCNLCGDKCAVDFATDNENCGSCGNVVPKGRTCKGGVPTCDAPTIECGGACVDPKTDPTHCGGCDQPVGPGAACKDGAPACTADYLTCKGKCVDKADEDNCTACGRTCPANTECTKLGGGGCLGRITTSTPAGVDCNFLCDLSKVPCVEGAGAMYAYASYQGTTTKRPVTCGVDPPQSITEGGVVRYISGLSCACLYPPE